MTSYAYIRVSTDKQDVENQRLEILKLANEKSLGKVSFLEETVSGKKSWKDRQIACILAKMLEGDALVVSELSRLGRSMLEIMEILSICTERKLRVYASKGNWSLNGDLQSKIVAMVMAMAAEIERDLISQRTRAALQTKKALVQAGHSWISKKGRVCTGLGRPPGPGKSKLDDHREFIERSLAAGITRKRIAADCHTTPGNLRHYLKMRGID